MENNRFFLFVTKAVTVLFYLVIGVLIFFIASSRLTGGPPEVFGYQIKTVLSGSMEPGIQTGSIIAVKTGGDKEKFKEYDVVTYMKNSRQFVTHRIIEVITKNDQVMYRTKGDHNDGPDTSLLLPDNIIAEYHGFTIPYAGYVIEFSRSKNGIFVFFILPGLLLICQSIVQVTRLIIREHKKNVSESVEDTPNVG